MMDCFRKIQSRQSRQSRFDNRCLRHESLPLEETLDAPNDEENPGAHASPAHGRAQINEIDGGLFCLRSVLDFRVKDQPYLCRLLRIAGTCLMCADMYLDGGVEVNLVHDGFHLIAAIMAASIVLPQVLAWVFLQANDMTDVQTLLRIMVFPCISTCVLSSFWLCDPEIPAFWRDSAICLVVVSIEPWHVLVQSWSNLSEPVQSIWTGIAEGMIEAPCSSTLTLYVSLLLSSVRLEGQPTWFLISTVTSLVAISRASTTLNYYGEEPGLLKYMRTLLLIKFPQVSSQVLGYAFFAFACRPLPENMEDLQEHNKSFLVWVFLLLEVSLNAGMIWSMAGKMSSGKVVILACTMTVAGPPSFLRILDAARPAHAIQHFMILLVMAAVSVNYSSHEHFQQISRHYYAFFVLFVATTLISFVGSLVSSVKSVSPADRIRAAGRRLDKALLDEDIIMAGLLIELEGAEVSLDKIHLVGECSCTLSEECFIDTGIRQNVPKWSGIAESHGKLYCCPRNSAEVMVIDPSTEAISYIDTRKEAGSGKWSGIAESHGKLYCCPYNAEEIMVIDPATDVITFLSTGRGQGGNKWSGIAESNGKLYCCPRDSSEVMVIDPATDALTFISIPLDNGKQKCVAEWFGIAECQGKLYCCPHNASKVMVIDPATDTITFIDTGVEQGGDKWFGIAECKGKLYCCPHSAAEVMVIDPAAGDSVSFIDTRQALGGSKWSGIVESRGKLYCCPYNASSVMVIDPASATEAISFIDTSSREEGAKWNGIVEINGKLYCCPRNSAEVMTIPLDKVKDTRVSLFERLFKRVPHLRPAEQDVTRFCSKRLSRI